MVRKRYEPGDGSKIRKVARVSKADLEQLIPGAMGYLERLESRETKTISVKLDTSVAHALRIADKQSSKNSKILAYTNETVFKDVSLIKEREKKYLDFIKREFGQSAEVAQHALNVFRETFPDLLSLNSSNDFTETFGSAVRPLTIPAGQVNLYQGKRESGDIYDFLVTTYAYSEGCEPLTLAHLNDIDPKAYRAYFNKQRTTPPPAALQAMTRVGGDEILERFGLDLASPEGVAEARRVMNVINARLYPRNER